MISARIRPRRSTAPGPDLSSVSPGTTCAGSCFSVRASGNSRSPVVRTSVGWMGAVGAFLALAATDLTSSDADRVGAAYLAMRVTAAFIISH